jgi:peptidoglycan-N-acetylglucosamine deacetylase
MIEAALALAAAALLVGLGASLWRALARRAGRPFRARRAALVLAPAALLLVAAAGWETSRSVTFQCFGRIVPRVETAGRVVALTFDDGPTPAYTGAVLAMLRRERVRATFFLTGAELERHPSLGARIAAEGHELGNHSYSHVRMVLRDLPFVRREIETTDRLIRAAGHRGPIHFRPPYGKKLLVLPHYLATTTRTTVTWDVEPESDPNVAATAGGIVKHVLDRTRPGSIIILHVMYPVRETSRQAVPGIIRGLRERGYRFVTVSELLRSKDEGGRGVGR